MRQIAYSAVALILRIGISKPMATLISDHHVAAGTSAASSVALGPGTPVGELMVPMATNPPVGERMTTAPGRQQGIVEFGLMSSCQPRLVTDEDVASVKALRLSDATLVEVVSPALIDCDLSAPDQVSYLSL